MAGGQENRRGTRLFTYDEGATSAARCPAAPPSKEEIATAIKQLSDHNFQVREKATAFLRRSADHTIAEAECERLEDREGKFGAEQKP